MARKYTQEEKQALLDNLEFEVADRTRKLNAFLAEGLENFTVHQENLILQIPEQVRNMTMRELSDKYNGDVHAALRGVLREELSEKMTGEIQRSPRKRKWIMSQEVDGEASGSGSGAIAPPTAAAPSESSRGIKTARLMNATPKKKPGSSTGPGTAQRARLLAAAGNKTPGNRTSRTMGRIPPASPSPQKSKPPFNAGAGASAFGRAPPSRPPSPSKPSSKTSSRPPPRPPSSATFNPLLPPKTPAYPKTAMRLPRRDESMLSMNGSPLANPYQLGMGWFKGVEQGEVSSDYDDHDGKDKTLNSIKIRRDPMFSSDISGPSTANTSKFHSRTNSQTNNPSSSSQPQTSTHSREASQNQQYSNSQPESSFPQHHLQPPHAHQFSSRSRTPTSTNVASALVAIQTKDGHLLEFDPLLTSPRALNALEGITDSAKKQAREEMGRLVQATVEKWKII